ncbi:cryptococcal mannosyltransferase 1-domain-containing protein [Naematelia encephala]|uniref:Cryptococcal mannosyltransferase 1-domain-containing protein n=1 Tax=Naematelia encephala TaxID=71784 RepID=A0A1Y2B9T6_9TREE|nr:cryptococcal mannosyltransferase 1-domain-containing protein [Naematelia encephala]
MKPVSSLSLGRKLPSGASLLVGILVGLLVASILRRGDSSSEPWQVSGAKNLRPNAITGSSRLQRSQITLPSLQQRYHILELISSLSAHHTKECTRRPQELYAEQVHDRYSVLVGHKRSWQNSGSWLARLLGGGPERQMPLASRRDNIRRDLQSSQHKYFFAINLYNSFDVIPDLFATLFRTAAVLGYHNVFVSIYENGSNDQTKALLRIFDALGRTVGLRIIIRTSMRTRGQFNHRIEYLAEVRNAAMVPLHELRDNENEVFDTIVFMNDILPCVDDLLELIWQSRRQNAGITCAADYMYHDDIGAPVFYDNWVARDINGTALENAPFEQVFHHPISNHRFQRHLPIQVQSCWNGIAVLDPAPFYEPPHVKFRMARLPEGECSASECGLICNDYWNAGYGRIIMVPRVKLAYDQKVYDIIHPERRNLTAIRGYKRIGGLPDDPHTDPQDRSWYGPHDRLFTAEEDEELDFQPGPEYVWCWGWDGAGDLDGPDVDPIWEHMQPRSYSDESIQIKHFRNLPQYA